MDNYRRRGYGYQQPPQINPNLVDFGQLPMYNPQDTERLAQIGQQAQQRYDASQATIAKYLEDVSAADFSGLDQETRDRLMLELDTNAARIQDRVSKDYQGDYGRALPDILRGLSRDRGLMHQGIQESAKAKQAFAEYQDLAKKGMAPQKYEPGKGLVTMSFEDYHEGRLPGFTEEGKFVGGQYAPLRGASDLTGYLDKGISKTLSNRVWQDILRENEKTPGFLEQVSRKGYTNEQLEKYFNSPDFNKEAFVQQLKGEVPHLAAEFEGVPESELFDYAKNIIKTQVSEQLMRDYKQDPNYKPVENTGGFGNLGFIPMNVQEIIQDEGKVEKEREDIESAIEEVLDPKVAKKAEETFEKVNTPNSTQPTTIVAGLGPTPQLQTRVVPYVPKIDRFKQDYGLIYEWVSENNPNLSPKDRDVYFLKLLRDSDIAANTRKVATGLLSPADIKVKDVFDKQMLGLLSLQTELTEYNENFKPKRRGKKSAAELVENKDASMHIRPLDGKIFIKSGGKTYGTPDIDMTSLPEGQKKAFRLMKEISQKAVAYDEKSAEPIYSDVPYTREYNGRAMRVFPIFQWKVNPNNPLQKELYETFTDGQNIITDNGEPITRKVNRWEEEVIGHLVNLSVHQTDPYGRNIQ